MGKFKPSNFGGDLMLEKSSDAMNTNVNAQSNINATNIYSQMNGSP